MNKKVLSIIIIEFLFSVIFIAILFSTQETLEYDRMINPEKYNRANNLVNISFIIYVLVAIILTIRYKSKELIWVIWITWITLFCFSISSIYLI